MVRSIFRVLLEAGDVCELDSLVSFENGLSCGRKLHFIKKRARVRLEEWEGASLLVFEMIMCS